MGIGGEDPGAHAPGRRAATRGAGALDGALARRTCSPTAPTTPRWCCWSRRHGIRILLTGDVEPPSQEVLCTRTSARSTCSRCRTTAAATRTRRCSPASARGSPWSAVGEDNDYGHPAAETLALLQHVRVVVRRTDQDGDVAVVVGPGGSDLPGGQPRADRRRRAVAGCVRMASDRAPPRVKDRRPAHAPAGLGHPGDRSRGAAQRPDRAGGPGRGPRERPRRRGAARPPGSSSTVASLGELSAPSLFSSTRFVVVRRLEDVPDEVHEGLVDYAGRPILTSPWCWCTRGGPKGSGLLEQAAQAADGHRAQVRGGQGQGFVQFVQTEARRHGARLDPDAAGPSSRRSAPTCGPGRGRRPARARLPRASR